MAQATRLYIANKAAPYTPATIRGNWAQTTGAVTGFLSPVPLGAQTTIGAAETSVTLNFEVLLGRWISNPLSHEVDFTTSNHLNWCIGALQSSSSAIDKLHVHVYVTTGDSDTVRGTLLTNNTGAVTFPLTAAGIQEAASVALGANVTAKVGDRIVIEIGYEAQNTSSTSFTGTINYGNTGPSDLLTTQTTVTVSSGWFEFDIGFDFGFALNNYQFPGVPVGNTGIISVGETFG